MRARMRWETAVESWGMGKASAGTSAETIPTSDHVPLQRNQRPDDRGEREAQANGVIGNAAHDCYSSVCGFVHRSSEHSISNAAAGFKCHPSYETCHAGSMTPAGSAARPVPC